MTRPEFIATYTRPAWALEWKMRCGHPAAAYDYFGDCQACGLEKYREAERAGKCDVGNDIPGGGAA
jgi:hypothetical protein